MYFHATFWRSSFQPGKLQGQGNTSFVILMKSDENHIQLTAVEDHDGILTIRGGGAQRNWNGIHYKQGMSAKNVGTKNLSANIATIPPGGVAYAHIHVGFEVILYIMEGNVRHEFGAGLKRRRFSTKEHQTPNPKRF